jgi:hypothetical protein
MISGIYRNGEEMKYTQVAKETSKYKEIQLVEEKTNCKFHSYKNNNHFSFIYDFTIGDYDCIFKIYKNRRHGNESMREWKCDIKTSSVEDLEKASLVLKIFNGEE